MTTFELLRESEQKMMALFKSANIPVKAIVLTRATVIVKMHGETHPLTCPSRQAGSSLAKHSLTKGLNHERN